MDLCLWLNNARTAKRIWMKFGIDIDYKLE